MTGREELGFAKLYCELPGSRRHRENCTWPAAWDVHEFARLSLWNLKDVAPPVSGPGIDGVIHHRFLPGVSSDGVADVDQMVLSPSGTPIRYDLFQRGEGSIEFIRSTWEQLPTMSHIVNALADLPVLAIRNATLAHTLGASDLSNQRVLL